MIKLGKEKKAQAHVEMIISFIIFISFIVALFFFLDIGKDKPADYSNLDRVEEKVFNNLSFNYWSVSVILKNSIPEDCFSLPDTLGINQTVIVQDLDGNIKPASINDGKIYISSSSGQRFYKLYFSDKFDEHALSTQSCPTLSNANYSFGVLGSERNLYYEDIMKFAEQYANNYSSLKNDLNIPDDFSFVVYDSDRHRLFGDELDKNKIKNSVVLSRESILKAINPDATETNIIFRLSVW